ncbi:global transcription factor group E4, partial [Striga asiatica]
TISLLSPKVIYVRKNRKPIPDNYMDEMVKLRDEVGFEIRAKGDVVLVEDYISEVDVSPIIFDKNEHGFDTSVLTNPSSVIIVFQKRQLSITMEIEKHALDLDNFLKPLTLKMMH